MFFRLCNFIDSGACCPCIEMNEIFGGCLSVASTQQHHSDVTMSPIINI